MKDAKIRLFVDQPLERGKSVELNRDQANYLFNVMRLGPGAAVLLINGRDGEFLAEVAKAGKRAGILTVGAQLRPLQMPPDLWLYFAPIKKARTDFIVEKAAEMGARRICPVQTEFTNADRIRQDRLQAHAVEAAEQCGGTYVPEVTALQKLGAVLDNWPKDRTLWFCDEALAEGATGLIEHPAGEKAAIIIGPEGGFSDAERAGLNKIAKPIRLGPRILRADTAAVAALTLWQTTQGDWQ